MDNRKKLLNSNKQQYFFRMSSQYGDLWPTNGWDRFTSLEHPTSFNRFLALASLLHRRRSMEVNQTLIISWVGTLYIHFWGPCPLTEFCQVENSLRPSLACSYIGSVTARLGSRTAHTGRPILTTCASYDVFPRRKVPLGVAMRLLPIWGSNPPKTILRAWIRVFKPNSQNIIKATASIPTSDKDQKMPSRVIQTRT